MAMAISSLSNLLASLVLSKSISTPSPPPAPLNLAAVSMPTSLQLPRTTATSTVGAITSVVWPSLAHANIFNFFNVQIKVEDDEAEERILNRFRRSVLRAGILQEAKRRRFFESNQDKMKRKSRAAARRNRKRPRRRKAPARNEAPKKKNKDDDEDEDNWEVPEGDIPYCNL